MFIDIILGLSAIDVFSLDFGLFSYLNVAVSANMAKVRGALRDSDLPTGRQ